MTHFGRSVVVARGSCVRRYRCGVDWRVDDFVDSLTSVSEATVEAYRRDVNGFVAWADRAGVDGPDAVDRLTLRRYLASLTTRRKAKRTIARTASSLRRYFGWLLRTGAIAVDPTARLSAPKGEARLPHVLRADELHRLLDDPPARVDDDPAFVRCRDDAVLELLYGSGLRVSEVCSLKVGDVDPRRKWLSVWGKGAKERRVPLSAPAATALREWLAHGRNEAIDATPPTASTHDALFVNRRGGRSRRETFAASSITVHPSPPIRTRCGTRSPRTCSMGAPTSGPYRSCSATPTSQRRRYTLT